MTSIGSVSTERRLAHRHLAIGLVALLAVELCLIIATLLLANRALVRGWFVAFGAWSTIPFGSLSLLLIHRLTGGEWGRAAAPVLRPAAALCPVAVIAFIPVLIFLPKIYSWAPHLSTVPPDVARWYLNEPLFLLRTIVALVGWSVLAIVFAMDSGSELLAGLGLAFFGLTISMVAVDWFLSLDPHYVASAFAATIAVQQLLAALAFAAVIGSFPSGERAAGDLGALMIAALLGVVYLELMTFVIAWYGDLPDKSAWYLKRATPVWESVLGVAVLCGAIVPFSMLLTQRVRRSLAGQRLAGAFILFGTILHFAWLLVPAFDDQAKVSAIAAAALVLLSLISVLIGSALRRMFAPQSEFEHAG